MVKQPDQNNWTKGELAKIDIKYINILKKTRPYILTFPENLSQYNLAPWDYRISDEHIFSCIDPRNAHFFDLLQSLDQLAFGPVGMPMEKWVFFDCGEMPGGICGLGIESNELSPEVQKLYKIDPKQNCFVPISMYIAIPMAAPGAWFGHNLSSANSVLGGAFAGLGLLTKALALKVFNISTLYGATQWNSKSLNIHLQLGDMEIMSAVTPAHTFFHTITYKSIYSDTSLLGALSGNPRTAEQWDQLIDVTDEPKILEMQDNISTGQRPIINGRPIYRDNKTFLPIKKA